MKIDRLIGILSVLLQEKKVTAPELAEKFEVSRRTINRDVMALSQAGIPLYTMQGTGGGIAIADGYRMDRTLLTSRDMQGILAGLRSLDSVSGNHYYRQLMEKIQVGASDFVSGRDYMLIDLSSWYKKRLAPTIERIQSAIETHHQLQFQYVSQSGSSVNTVEPYYLIFKWSNWYLWAWNETRSAFRLYKLNRMTQLELSPQQFNPRQVSVPQISTDQFATKVWVKALFHSEVKWRLLDEFGADQITEQADGQLLLAGEYSDLDSLVRWLLTFGDQVEVLAPDEARQHLIETAKDLLRRYD